MAYPDNIDSFSTKVDNQDDVMANHINQVQASIVAVENELGVNPSGTDASVKSRLDRIDSSLSSKALQSTVDNLQAQINRNFYDDYLRTLELYYTGHFSGVDVTGQKGMTFDGFMNTDRVNTGVTTATVNTTAKLVGCPATTTTNIRPTTATFISCDNTQQTSYDTVGTNMIDTNTSTYSDVCASAQTNRTVTAVWKFDLGSIKFVSSLIVSAHSAWATSSYQIRNVKVSDDGVKWVSGIMPDSNFSAPETTPTTSTLSFSLPVSFRYIQLDFALMRGSSGNWDNVYIHDIQFSQSTPASKILQTTQKTLEQNINKATLYVSSYKSGASWLTHQLSDNGGTSFTNLTLVSSRPDPLNSEFIEEKYEVTFSGTNNLLVFKSSLNVNGTNAPLIKRYGITWQ